MDRHERCDAGSNIEESIFMIDKHIAFWLRHLRMLPTIYTSEDIQRMTLAYFCLGALDLLGAVEMHIKDEERKECIDWIYAQQLPLRRGGGFCSSPYLSPKANSANIAMTYTALLNLAILRDDFSRLEKTAILAHLRGLQQKDGSFAANKVDSESDSRFVYCAFAICEMLQDWSSIDIDAAVSFLLRSQSYDGGFGQGPNQESQGGSTYCAVAALSLCNRLDELGDSNLLQDWLLHRQQSFQGGFNGRIEKDEDVCYSFWCGASAQIIGIHSQISISDDVRWLLSCQTSLGGISKIPKSLPDVMHSYLGLAALSMHAIEKELDNKLARCIKPIDPCLNISLDSLAWLRKHL